MRALALLAALVLALTLAGCGGNDDAADEPADTPPPAETEEPTDGAEPAGRQLFIANCGACHTLSDADTSGTIGPPLDNHGLSEDDIETQVREGGGGMPPFEGTLSDEEIQEVVAYVAAQGG
jgi:mono/diheme cytochrome c family protein